MAKAKEVVRERGEGRLILIKNFNSLAKKRFDSVSSAGHNVGLLSPLRMTSMPQ